jgi:hypothetical protein
MSRFFRAAVGLPAHGLTPPEALIERHGFQRRGRREFSHGLLRGDLYERTVTPARRASS